MLDEIDMPTEPDDPPVSFSGSFGPLPPANKAEPPKVPEGASLSMSALSTEFSPGERIARLVVHDVRGSFNRVLGAWPRGPEYDRFALVARYDGSFVLIVSHEQGFTRAWAGTAVGLISWTGLAEFGWRDDDDFGPGDPVEIL